MRIPLIHRKFEGEFSHQGINWDRNLMTTFMVLIRIWRFSWYFRIRNMKKFDKKTTRKYIFHFDFYQPSRICDVGYDFDTRTFDVSGYKVSAELIEYLAETGELPTKP